MKLYLSFVAGILILLNSNNVHSQNFDSSKYKRIESIYYDLDSNDINIFIDSIVFNGYMVFKFDKNNQNLYVNPQNDGLITVESYWMNNLTNFENSNKDYYLMSNYFLYYMYATQDVGESIMDTNEVNQKYIDFLNSKEYLGFKRLFNKYYDFDKKSVNKDVFLKKGIFTSIFDDPSVIFVTNGENDSVGYYIFRCSFSAAVLKYKSFIVRRVNENNESKEHLGIIKVLLPISQAYYFTPANENDLSKNGFKNAKWYPNVIYKK